MNREGKPHGKIEYEEKSNEATAANSDFPPNNHKERIMWLLKENHFGLTVSDLSHKLGTTQHTNSILSSIIWCCKDSCVEAGGGCLHKWNCGNWSECISGKQARACPYTGSCTGGRGKIEERDCKMPYLPEEMPPEEIPEEGMKEEITGKKSPGRFAVSREKQPIIPLSTGIILMASLTVVVVGLYVYKIIKNRGKRIRTKRIRWHKKDR